MEVTFVREPSPQEIDSICRWSRTTSKILQFVKERGTVTKEDLVSMMGYSVGTINAQISILKRANLVKTVNKSNYLSGTAPAPSAEALKMRLITWDEYRQYVAAHGYVTVENVKIEVGRPHRITSYAPPSVYKLETTTVWSFPDRGDWATHAGNYRGNWSPYVPRNLIEKYTRPGEWVLDQMVGSGTTLVEAKLLGRNAIGVDINYQACILAMDRVNFDFNPLNREKAVEIRVYHGDASNLDAIQDESIDLVATHPPYWNIIPYNQGLSPHDLSNMRKLEDYLKKMKEIARESFRVLKPGRHCAILIGDTRKHKHYVPISVKVMNLFLQEGFILADDIIKLQHKMKTTRERWRAQRFEVYGFHKIAHEHLYVFRKPANSSEYSKLRLSTALER